MADNEKTELSDKPPAEQARELVAGAAEQGKPVDQAAADAAAKATADAAAAEAAKAAGAGGDKGDKGDTTPALTPEQLDTLARDPAFVAKVLGSDAASSVLDEVVSTLLSDKETAAQKKQEQDAHSATLAEAWKKGSEEGDYSEFGKLVADDWQRQSQRAAVEQALRPAVEESLYDDVDGAILDAFGEDVIGRLSEDDKTALNRSNFQSEREYTAAVLNKLLDARDAARAPDANAQAQAARNAATAEKAKGDAGMAALPGGTATQKFTGGESIGELVRAGIGDLATDYEG